MYSAPKTGRPFSVSWNLTCVWPRLSFSTPRRSKSSVPVRLSRSFCDFRKSFARLVGGAGAELAHVAGDEGRDCRCDPDRES